MTTRIYRVHNPNQRDAAGNPVKARLVRAPNAAGALRHVAQEFIVSLASQDELVVAIGAGVKVEESNSSGSPASS